MIKDIKHVLCTPTISVPVKDNEVTYKGDLSLIATINCTGNLNRGHYTSINKKCLIQNHGLQWCSCELIKIK